MNSNTAHPDKIKGRSVSDQVRGRRRLLVSLAMVLSLSTAALFLSLLSVQADDPANPQNQAASEPPAELPAATAPDATPVTKLPPLPEGVVELKFSEFFVQPIGPRGLELSQKLLSLEGRRVRILGYMAQQSVQSPGGFLLTPFPIKVCDHDNRLAEDFPVTVVQVSVPTIRTERVPFAQGLMLLTGTLHTGNRAEPDGRNSLVRLDLDPP